MDFERVFPFRRFLFSFRCTAILQKRMVRGLSARFLFLLYHHVLFFMSILRRRFQDVNRFSSPLRSERSVPGFFPLRKLFRIFIAVRVFAFLMLSCDIPHFLEFPCGLTLVRNVIQLSTSDLRVHVYALGRDSSRFYLKLVAQIPTGARGLACCSCEEP